MVFRQTCKFRVLFAPRTLLDSVGVYFCSCVPHFGAYLKHFSFSGQMRQMPWFRKSETTTIFSSWFSRTAIREVPCTLLRQTMPRWWISPEYARMHMMGGQILNQYLNPGYAPTYSHHQGNPHLPVQTWRTKSMCMGLTLVPNIRFLMILDVAIHQNTVPQVQCDGDHQTDPAGWVSSRLWGAKKRPGDQGEQFWGVRT